MMRKSILMDDLAWESILMDDLTWESILMDDLGRDDDRM